MIKKKKGKVPVQKGKLSFEDNKKNYKFETPRISSIEDTEDAFGRRSGKELRKMGKKGY